MRALSCFVLLCVATLSVEGAGYKCKTFGQICAKGQNCIPRLRSPSLICRSRKLLGSAAKLCRFGGSWCPDGKSCGNSSGGRRCVRRKGSKVHRCRRLGQFCAKGRKCIPCYLRSGLCCRRASLLGKRRYCGTRYSVKSCGKGHSKKACWRYGTFCPDGKSCRKSSRGKRRCMFKRKQPKCRYFGQICGLKNDRNCIPCYSRSGLCCRRRKLLATAAKHCRFGGSWCPERKSCGQSVVKGVVTRRCLYVARCKHFGQACGHLNSNVCVRCGHKLCCRAGVTKAECRRGCKGGRSYCSLTGCGHGFSGWCCIRHHSCKGKKHCKG